MATLRSIYCKECLVPFHGIHHTECSHFINSLYVKVEHCSTDQMVSESIEAEVPPTSDQPELSLHLSDHLHFEDKL